MRLVTLSGPGGIGKTRLAIAVGEQLDGNDPRPMVFVPLASITQPEMVLPRIAIAVGVSMEGTRRPLDALIEHFVETPTLLVLDNLEQVIGMATELDQLLSSCPGLQILATSRAVVRLRAEREYPVGALAVPEFAERPPLEQLASLPAVQLFVDRAMAVRYDFALTDDNALAVAEICRRLDGLPLAIELAAARTRVLDPVALLARLEHVLVVLGTGPVDLPERQRTLRATVEWSIGLLDDAQQQLLGTLAVFVDGWSVPAAAHVSEHTEDQVFDLLDALVGHSLVSGQATYAGPRFRMLTSVRELAAERLAARADHDAVARRHAEYFGSLVENADWPAERQAEWADRLHIDEENVRVAVRWFFTNDRTPLPHVFRVLFFFWLSSDLAATIAVVEPERSTRHRVQSAAQCPPAPPLAAKIVSPLVAAVPPSVPCQRTLPVSAASISLSLASAGPLGAIRTTPLPLARTPGSVVERRQRSRPDRASSANERVVGGLVDVAVTDSGAGVRPTVVVGVPQFAAGECVVDRGNTLGDHPRRRRLVAANGPARVDGHAVAGQCRPSEVIPDGHVELPALPAVGQVVGDDDVRSRTAPQTRCSHHCSCVVG